MKRCARCGREQTLDQFHVNKTSLDGKGSWCRSCYSEVGKEKRKNPEWRAKNQEYQKIYMVEYRKRIREDDELRKHINQRQTAWRYGLSLESYLLLIANGCEVCESMEKLQVDHDHSCCPGSGSCGKCVRGCLCLTCNAASGFLGDDLGQIEKLSRYHQKYQKSRR